MKKKIILSAYGIFGILALTVAVFFIYTSDYYHADPEILSQFADKNSSVTVVERDDNITVYSPENGSEYGLIFYPGALVESEAYAPLLTSIAERGITCICADMPFNLAIFGIDRAKEIIPSFDNIRHWYIGGHSLGGAMASSFAAGYEGSLDGLVLFAAYSVSDISKSGLNVISVYGSNDGVLNKDAYDNKRKNLPEKINELVIKGGCHSYFGAYGMQEGDGVPTVSRDDQVTVTAQYVSECIKNNK